MLSEGRFRQLGKGRVLLVSLVATVVLTAFFPMVAGHFRLTLLDSIADPTEARALIEGLTGAQREAHAWITGTLDMAYPLAYGALFLGAARRFFPRRGTLLGIPVLIGVPADFLEGLVQMLALTGQLDWLAAKAVLTPVKGGAFVYGAGVALLGVVLSFRGKGMADFYQPGHRALQREFESTALADRLETLIVRPELDAEAQAFIEQQDHFFLSTLGADGFPSVSYKGGDCGFVKINDRKTLCFPCFDGNGMWLSMGNIADHGKVGLLFINAVTPHRVRIHGVAKLVRDPAVLNRWKDVGLAVEVTIQSAWINCPRYIHPMEKQGQSSHVPNADRETAPAEWKSLEVVADVLPPQPHEVKK